MAALDGWDLERYRAYLRTRARLLSLDRRVRVRFDESDLVQETLLRATATSEPCRGQTDRERVAWLERIQDRVLIDKDREHRADKRDVAREQDLHAALLSSTADWEGNVADDSLGPDDQAVRREMFLRVIEAVGQLPPDQRDAVMALRLLNLSPGDAAERLGKTEGAVVGLYQRGIKALQGMLKNFARA